MAENPRRARVTGTGRSAFDLAPDEAARWTARFGAAEDQIRHDFVISHLLAAIAPVADKVVFYGGTALSRTFLPDLRLSEDIDLLSVGPRRPVAPLIDEAIRAALEPGFGPVTADPWLADVRRAADACVFRIGDVDVKIQLIDGTNYTPWPTQPSTISLRYRGLEDVTMTTLTAAGFVCAKTTAWSEPTRDAPRDLYDLWALAQHGRIDDDAAELFKQRGPTRAYPRRWLVPSKPPTEDAWQAALSHQCIPQVSAEDAHHAVIEAWRAAVEQASGEDF
jgi:predicted nucleotidyltransferase component of viral defense system